MGIVLLDIVKSLRIEVEVVAMIFASQHIAVVVRRMGMRPASTVAARAGSVMARVVVVTLNAIRTVVRGHRPGPAYYKRSVGSSRIQLRTINRSQGIFALVAA